MNCQSQFPGNKTDTLYIYLDETGDLDFVPTGSARYGFGCLWSYDMDCFNRAVTALNLSALRSGNKPVRHARIDTWPERLAFFELISKHRCAKAAALSVAKNKINPVLYEPHVFYPKFIDMLIKFALYGERTKRSIRRIEMQMANAPTRALAHALKTAVNGTVPTYIPGASFNFEFETLANEPGLQLVDYVLWACARKWNYSQDQFWDQIKHLFDRVPLDITEKGTTTYY